MLRINKKLIGDNKPVYFVAEAGLNHNGKLDLAKKLITEAHKAGADAIKFQTYKTEEFVSKSNKYFKLFKNVELKQDDFTKLKNHAKKIGITFFSAPFDIESAKFLKKINIPCFKIASSDLTNLPLIEFVAKTKKPIILSTGSSNINEISEAIKCCLKAKNKNIIILHCVASYPAQPEDVNLTAMKTLKEKFGLTVGFSDNGDSTLVDLVAVSMGASVIEKHFTLDNKLPGPDHSFSINPKNLQRLITNIRQIETMKGNGLKIPTKSEIKGKKALRKSIVTRNSLKKNQVISKEDIAVKRPAGGIEPKYFNKIVGKRVLKNLDSDVILSWSDIKKHE
jgi:N,N'-diacetyllegionaminate synthase